MKILLVQDADNKTGLSRDLLTKLRAAVRKHGHSLEIVDLGMGDIAYCTGCLRCWAAGSTECITRDRMPEIEEKLTGCGLVVFLTPAVFGTFSSTIKTAVDKGLGCKLESDTLYPRLFIGYGEDIGDEEKQSFTGIIEKHMGYADVVHPELSGMPADAMVTRSPAENSILVETIEGSRLREGVE